MAHNFLLLVFVFATTLVAGFSSIQKLPPPEYGKTINILSIDGGALKGLIPATVLHHLDEALKKKDPNANLADFFDVIAGTSTGGLIAAMLASPSSDDPTRPGFTPKTIMEFYMLHALQIFNPLKHGNCSFFDGTFLHDKIREILKDTRISQTLTNVVIPTFDMKTQKPVIFSNYKLEKYPYFNAKMSDICISTSAAPTILPAYYFENDGVEFNMIDGGAAAGNPTQAAISEVMRHNKDIKIQVLSLGTGVSKVNETYDVNMTCTWNSTTWTENGQKLVARGSADMIEHYLATIFSGLQPVNNYLRIEEYDLDPFLNGILGDPYSMGKLLITGEELLKKGVVRMNVDTFDLQETNEGTNADALDRLAKSLHEERELRLKRKSAEEKRGRIRPFIQTIKMPFGAQIPAA